jgi:hypothetical protein
VLDALCSASVPFWPDACVVYVQVLRKRVHD